MTDIDIELEHILLDAKYERWEQVARFLFPYFCYKNNYVTSKGKPDWELARQSCRRSQAVTSCNQAELVAVIPEQSIIGVLKNLERHGDLCLHAVTDILNTHLNYVVIAKAEKSRLIAFGLHKTMPANWFTSDQPDPYARFIAADITL